MLIINQHRISLRAGYSHSVPFPSTEASWKAHRDCLRRGLAGNASRSLPSPHQRQANMQDFPPSEKKRAKVLLEEHVKNKMLFKNSSRQVLE